MNKKEILERLKAGMSYTQFLEKAKQIIDNPYNEYVDKFDTRKLNFSRSNRIWKNYAVNPKLCDVIKNIKSEQDWLVLTEDWCGDSAQILPYIAKFVQCNSKINMRILLRDENLDLMDKYLTNGKSRSIPKIIAFDKNGNELFQWGPRPKAAMEIVEQSKKLGLPSSEYSLKLHKWYNENKGKEIEREFYEIISQLNEN